MPVPVPSFSVNQSERTITFIYDHLVGREMGGAYYLHFRRMLSLIMMVGQCTFAHVKLESVLFLHFRMNTWYYHSNKTEKRFVL